MASEERIKQAFAKAKEDVEGVKNELAFALKRIAKLEDMITKQAISGITFDGKGSRKKKA